MGLDMYAYRMRLDAVDRYAKHMDDPVGDVTLASFPARKAARYFVGHVDKTPDDLQRLTTLEREDYWSSQLAADRKAKEQGVIDTDYHYWRKFNALHGWMEDLWRERTGAGGAEDFNCKTVRLLEDDLLRLEGDRNSLRPRGGFFFGSEEIYPEDLTSLDSFIRKARQDVKDYAIFYDSWW